MPSKAIVCQSKVQTEHCCGRGLNQSHLSVQQLNGNLVHTKEVIISQSSVPKSVRFILREIIRKMTASQAVQKHVTQAPTICGTSLAVPKSAISCAVPFSV